MNERRSYSRLPFPADCFVVVDGNSLPAKLIDISLKGASVERPKDWPGAPDQKCELWLHLDDSLVTLNIKMIVAHDSEDQLGLRCESIDLESISHLRRLLELNSGDPKLIEQELLM